MKIKELIEKLEQKSSHQFLKAVSKPEFAFPLPQDLKSFMKIMNMLFLILILLVR